MEKHIDQSAAQGRQAHSDGASTDGLAGDILILEIALRKEQYSIQMYKAMRDFVQREDSKKLLDYLILDEEHHYQILNKARLTRDYRGIGGPVVERSLEIPDYIVKQDIRSNSGPEEIVKMAIRREDEAEEFYLGRIGFISNSELKALYRRLAEEEAAHRQKLLAMYDDLIIMNLSQMHS